MKGCTNNMWSIDVHCVGCGSCAYEAPENIKADHFIAQFYKQPENEEELLRCKSALLGCPVRAIHEN